MTDAAAFGMMFAAAQQHEQEYIKTRVDEALAGGLSREQIMQHQEEKGTTQKVMEWVVPFGDKIFESQEKGRNEAVADRLEEIRSAMAGKISGGNAVNADEKLMPVGGGRDKGQRNR